MPHQLTQVRAARPSQSRITVLHAAGEARAAQRGSLAKSWGTRVLLVLDTRAHLKTRIFTRPSTASKYDYLALATITTSVPALPLPGRHVARCGRRCAAGCGCRTSRRVASLDDVWGRRYTLTSHFIPQTRHVNAVIVCIHTRRIQAQVPPRWWDPEPSRLLDHSLDPVATHHPQKPTSETHDGRTQPTQNEQHVGLAGSLGWPGKHRVHNLAAIGKHHDVDAVVTLRNEEREVWPRNTCTLLRDKPSAEPWLPTRSTARSTRCGPTL